MRAAVLLTALAVFTASTAGGQVAGQIPAQKAGATDWFGEEALRVRGGPRVEVEPRVDGFCALLHMTPDGRLEVVRAVAVAARKQSFDVPRPRFEGTVRVPFVVTTTTTSTSPGGGMPPVPSSGPHTTPPQVQAPRDGIMIILSDVALDSAEIVERLNALPEVHPDSLADGLGRLVVGRRTAMWAAYYQAR